MYICSSHVFAVHVPPALLLMAAPASCTLHDMHTMCACWPGWPPQLS
jgi:hypothetical protein